MKKLLYLLLFIPAISYSQQWTTSVENNAVTGKTITAYIEGTSNNPDIPVPGLRASFNDRTMMVRWHLISVPYLTCKIGQYPIMIRFGAEKKAYKAYGWGQKGNVWIQLLPGKPLAAEEISEKEFCEKIKANKTIAISYITECGTFETEFSLAGSSKALAQIYREVPAEQTGGN